MNSYQQGKCSSGDISKELLSVKIVVIQKNLSNMR